MVSQELVRLIARPNGGRRIIAIVGAQASGNPTLAERLVARLYEEGYAALLPLDGYHYDDRDLIERGLRARKGYQKPSTCSACMLDRLRRNRQDEIAVPVFDRDLGIS